MTVHLFDVATDREIGVLSDAQFQFLQDHLEEESDDDDDYYINRATLELWEAQQGDAQVVSLLRSAMGSREEMDVRWQREDAAEPTA